MHKRSDIWIEWIRISTDTSTLPTSSMRESCMLQCCDLFACDSWALQYAALDRHANNTKASFHALFSKLRPESSLYVSRRMSSWFRKTDPLLFAVIDERRSAVARHISRNMLAEVPAAPFCVRMCLALELESLQRLLPVEHASSLCARTASRRIEVSRHVLQSGFSFRCLFRK